MIRRQLLGPRPAAFLVRLRLFPPAEFREVQGVQLFQVLLLNRPGPLLKPLREVGFAHTPPSGQAGFPPRARSTRSP